jgi:hypothetical protein
MKDYKGWKFKGRELSYIKNILSSDFRALSSGTMNERLEIKSAMLPKRNKSGCRASDTRLMD